ncbi:glucose-6-phosphate dehydrogenase assembly protein OpcA [Candidatus Neptunochlamydia vexilliferae]|uniref:Glucose-6-phosphate dehydrogenase subunit n=1 Tax=Candidatus Neptunichlamydia vexilliferae TaxID=1651774 RepID=A0ABS0AYD3_9BACT|nr:glucose-6-phosphate dehydrogenase assembly protein OpcA [Candidatus Neptunochlamydia vexilliferae]MBF5059147.1 hypothetical protein [Candidatus Neptunochlamydia vexilliferae]
MVETVHPAQIESQLQQIWDSLQGTNKMRACLFNLIVYAKKCQRSGYLNDIVQKVIEKFPSRIIFITYDDACSSKELKASVSVMTADEGECEIVCDLIDIEVCSKDHPRVPFVILPHILPDLPIYLVHADDPTYKNPVAKQLENLADRIIFDSEAASDLQAYAKAVLSHMETFHADVADLNWARTEGWRQLFANIFKSEEALSHIQKAKKITITYNSKTADYLCHTDVQAIYFKGWLTVQLGFETEIELVAGEMEEVHPGRLLAITVETSEGYHYLFKRKEGRPEHILIEKSSPEACEVPTIHVFDKATSGQSLVKEICHKGTSAHYTNMLKYLIEGAPHG